MSDAQRAAVTDPVVRNLLPLIPAANATSATGAPRFVGTGTANVDIDQWTGDINHQFSQNDTLHAYYAYQRDERGEPNLQGNTIPGFGDTRTSNRQIAVVLPQITVQGVGLNFGGPSAFPQGRIDTTFVVSDTLSYMRGRHAFKFGGEYRRFRNENFQTNGGTFTYPSLADFQAGRGSAFTVTLGDIDSTVSQQAVGFFVQDNFKVRSNVTLDLGFRYDLIVSPTEADDRFVYFDPGTAALVRVGQGAGTRSTATSATTSRGSASSGIPSRTAGPRSGPPTPSSATSRSRTWSRRRRAILPS